MTSSNIKLIHDAIAHASRPSSFVKKGGSWYAARAESVLVINPQKSQCAYRYYLNLGVYFNALGSDAVPKQEHCHLRARIEMLLAPDERQSADGLLDFEQPVAERQARLIGLLQEKGLPFLEACSSMEGLRQAQWEGRLDALPLVKMLRERI